MSERRMRLVESIRAATTDVEAEALVVVYRDNLLKTLSGDIVSVVKVAGMTAEGTEDYKLGFQDGAEVAAEYLMMIVEAGP